MSWFDPLRKYLARWSPLYAYELGRRYQLQGRLDEASELFALFLDTPEGLVEIDVDELTEVLLHIGQCHLAAGRRELAESIFRRALSHGIQPITGRLAMNMGLLLKTLGRTSEAGEMFSLAFSSQIMVFGRSSPETAAFFRDFGNSPEAQQGETQPSPSHGRAASDPS